MTDPDGNRPGPCPKCGSKDLARGCDSIPQGPRFYIGCRQCGYIEEESDPGLAIAKWNREDERMGDDEPNLKPCPFCGAGRENLLILDHQDYGFYWKTGIYCYGCRSTILYDSDTDDEDRMLKEAVRAWNRRRGSK